MGTVEALLSLLRKLPLFAMVAFAVRIARRVQPVLVSGEITASMAAEMHLIDQALRSIEEWLRNGDSEPLTEEVVRLSRFTHGPEVSVGAVAVLQNAAIAAIAASKTGTKKTDAVLTAADNTLRHASRFFRRKTAFLITLRMT